jgi:hypothetical protein
VNIDLGRSLCFTYNLGFGVELLRVDRPAISDSGQDDGYLQVKTRTPGVVAARSVHPQGRLWEYLQLSKLIRDTECASVRERDRVC